MYKRTLPILSILLLLSLTFLSYSKQKKQGTTKKPLEKIVFALDWTPNTNHTGLYVAQKLGYFADAGLEVEIRMPQSSSTQLVATNKAQFGIGFQEFSTASMGNEDIPIVSVAAVIQHNTSGFTSLANRNITRPKDFENKINAGWGNPFEQALIADLIRADGGDPDKLTSVTIGETSLAGLLQDKVDFAWTYYAWQNIGFDLQGLDTHFIPLRKLNPVFDYYTPIVITSRNYLAANKETGRRFVQALAKGYEYAAQNPKQAAEILLDYAPELDLELVLRSQEYLAPFYLDENGKWGLQKPEVWDRLSAWMLERGLLDNEVRSETAMTNELLE